MIYVYPYQRYSDSAKKLKRILGARWLRSDRLVRANSVIINWGCSTPPLTQVPMINSPEGVALAANKLRFYRSMDAAGVRVPKWTTEFGEARTWENVVSRLTLTGYGGKGIVLGHDPRGKVFTKYVKKDRELRVHVFDGNACIVQEKRRKLDVPDHLVNWRVRNHNNGFVYASELAGAVNLSVYQDCIKAVKSLGLTFGAVDIMITKSGKSFVLEVNTAPGLYGSTKYEYAKYLNQIIMDKYGVDV